MSLKGSIPMSDPSKQWIVQSEPLQTSRFKCQDIFHDELTCITILHSHP